MMQLRGREIILRLLEGGLKRSSPDEELTEEYLRGSREALGAGRVLSSLHPEVAYEQSHDCIRKAFTAFLNAQGLRPSSDAGHHSVVIEAVEAQIGPALGALIKRVLVIKKTRNALQYPQSVVRIDADAASDALDTAQDVLRGIEQLLSSGRVPVFR